jgi:hypothetical protein
MRQGGYLSRATPFHSVLMRKKNGKRISSHRKTHRAIEVEQAKTRIQAGQEQYHVSIPIQQL